MAAPSPHVLGIDPKLYRHFAALTLAISFTIAFLANGIQSQALSDGTTKSAKVAKGKAPRSEMDVLNGTPEDPSPAKASAVPPPPPPTIDEGPIDPAARDDGYFSARNSGSALHHPTPRIDRALLARMTPAQRAAYLSALAQQGYPSTMDQGGVSGGGPGAPTQDQMDRLVSASRARSGTSD